MSYNRLTASFDIILLLCRKQGTFKCQNQVSKNESTSNQEVEVEKLIFLVKMLPYLPEVRPHVLEEKQVVMLRRRFLRGYNHARRIVYIC